MNRFHHWFCQSNAWRKTVGQRVPWVVGNVDLGDNVLEIGPGPGLTTDLLQLRSRRLTLVELDHKLAGALRARFSGDRVDVLIGDATTMPFPDGHFSAVVSFTMLHHLSSPQKQDKLLKEACRVLRAGGVFVGSDSRNSLTMRLMHIGDTLVLVDPDTFGMRLEAAGFNVRAIEKGKQAFRFHAQRRLPVGVSSH